MQIVICQGLWQNYIIAHRKQQLTTIVTQDY